MRECKTVKPVAVCPVCSKGEKEEIADALTTTQAQLDRLKRQARTYKSRLRSIERKEAKAAGASPEEKPDDAK
jgi:predicted  nucleic acid-binding Zn-ribbon protein